MAVKPIPDGYHSVTPYVVCDDVAKVIDFLKGAFDAVLVGRMDAPNGRAMHAEVRIGDSMVMLGEAPPDRPPMIAMLYLYVRDTDAAYKKAVQAGGKSLREPTDMFYGDRNAAVTDSAGNQWWIATHVEDVAPAELERRAREARG